MMVAAAWVSSLSFFLSLPLNQASIGLIVWWRSWFDVADQGGAMVDDGLGWYCGSDGCGGYCWLRLV